MKCLLVFCLAISSVLSESCQKDLFSDEFISYINSLNTTWRAGRTYPERTTIESLEYSFGVDSDFKNNRLPLKTNTADITDLPESFDARTRWPECSSIRMIYDQGQCGSSWVFGATPTMSDRICIQSKGKKNLIFSPNYMLACCNEYKLCSSPCVAGFPSRAWQYWVKNGIISGGLYNSSYGCQPYEIKPCDRLMNGLLTLCSQTKVTVPECKQSCVSTYNIPFDQDLHYGKEVYSISSNPKDIMMEVYRNGPVQVIFEVYEDFMSYKSGIYQHVAGCLVSAHSVRLIGWGVENGTPYWLLANSWNSDWGENGTFRVLRGRNECLIESFVYAGLPKLD